jgi:hypothetical protein
MGSSRESGDGPHKSKVRRHPGCQKTEKMAELTNATEITSNYYYEDDCCSEMMALLTLSFKGKCR